MMERTITYINCSIKKAIITHTHTHTQTHTHTHTHTEWVLQEANKKIGTVSKSASLDFKNENMIRGVFRYLTNIQDGAFAKIVKSNIIPM